MNQEVFNSLPMPDQNIKEWYAFLQFIEAHFKDREIASPVVVELGTGWGNQQKFYKKILKAKYIGIDINSEMTAIIKGNTHDPKTMTALKRRLRGRGIDLLFIDACHCYHDVKQDYQDYKSLVNPGGIIAFHDIMTIEPGVGVNKLWNEILNDQDEDCLKISFYCYQNYRYQFGIGLLIKG